MIRDDAIIQWKRFQELNLGDPFFDSLKAAYAEFENWFVRKGQQPALVVFDDNGYLQGFLYLKREVGPVTDVNPPINIPALMKVGTFKINAHGTRLGERFVKKMFDCAMSARIPLAYITVFPEHLGLISLLERYGFNLYGFKETPNGREAVYLKSFYQLVNDPCLDFPILNAIGKRKWLLAIKPDFHSRLFPDSLLKTESPNIVEDLSYANSIHKIYISFAPNAQDIQRGDVVAIYRTAEEGKPAEYNSVVSSLCLVEEVRPRHTFISEQDFVNYCIQHSVFSEPELRQWFKRGANVTTIRMTYNIALPKRPNRRTLAEEVGLDRSERWTLLPLTDEQFSKLLIEGQVYEGSVVNQAGVC